MPVYINNNKIIPAPQAVISKEIRRSEDGTARKIDYTITLNGKLVAFAGSPNSTGVFWNISGYPPDENIPADSRLASIIRKQGALNDILCNSENRFVEIQPYDGTAPIKALVKLRSINFPEGRWFDTCDYTIQFDVIRLWYGNVEACSGGTATTTPPEESWTVEQADDRGRTYRVQHTVSSSAKPSFDDVGNMIKPAWQVARDIVLSNSPMFLGLDTAVFKGPNALALSDSFGAYNYVRGQQIDEAAGRYTATESWLLYDPTQTGTVPALEEYNINIRTSEDGRTRVNIEGNITGFEVRNNTTYVDLVSTRWTNASARWIQLEPQLYTLVNSNAGVSLNPTPLSKSVGKNILNGTISFSREFDDRPTIIPGALSATIQVSDSKPTDVFASLVVIGKPEGPVLQSIGTVTSKRRNLAIEIVLGAATVSSTPSKPNVDSIVTSYNPGGFKDRDEETWSEQTGRYSRQVSWTWV